MAPIPPNNQGGEIPLSGLSGATPSGARARAGGEDSLLGGMDSLNGKLERTKRLVSDIKTSLGGWSGAISGLLGGGGGMSSKTNMPLAGTVASGIRGGGPGGPGGGGGGGSVSGTINALRQQGMAMAKPLMDLNSYANQRIGQGAEYSLQADRMSVQLQQMYGMSNAQVRNQLRMPLTTHYLLGGGAAINDLLGMQARTGLTAAKQASTVESFRAISGFSYGSADVTRMLSSMATPEVANRMFMMGGTGMYGIGGKERTGMQTIQDIVRRTGLTNPEALKGALQQGSNTRMRLSAMGVPEDMQDMVIQYAMQNNQYQRKTGGTAMYDPSMETNRRTMGIEGSYAVQHEKTTGERLKREERFYGRQVDNFADFERNLRSATKILAAFEDALSGIVGLKISTAGHPLMNAAKYGISTYGNYMSSVMNTVGQVGDLAMQAGVGMGMGGDPIDGLQATPRYATGGDATTPDSGTKLSANNEAKLATLDPRLAGPLRKMLSDKPNIQIGDARRSSAQQERSFKARYTRRPDLSEKTSDADRIWNGEVWVYDQHAQKGPPMAPPGQSMHEQGLAADLSQSENEWIRANAAKYGLSHGGTTKGANTDEPFHVQPAGVGLNTSKTTSGSTGATSGRVSASSVSKSSARGYARMSTKTSVPSGGVTSSNAGAMASQIAQQMATENSRLLGTSKEISLGGDPIDQARMNQMGGGGMNITIAPNIYLQGGQGMSGDMRRIAKEVGDLFESEVKLRMMRQT